MMRTQSRMVSPCPSKPGKAVVEVVVIGDDERPLEDLEVVLRSAANGYLRDVTDARGRCRFVGIPEGETTEIALVGLDASAWELVTTLRLAPKVAVAPAEGSWTAFEPKARPKTTHKVAAGECLLKIAYAHGFLPQTLWTINAKQWGPCHRKGVLSVGQRLEIPPRAVGWQSVQAGQIAVVHRIGIPVVMTLQLRDAQGRAWANSPYMIELSTPKGRPIPHRVGTTDREGRLHVSTRPDVTRGRLHIEPAGGGRRWTFVLSIGTLLPADEPEGARARLWNLGYRDNRDNRLWHDTDALASFQWNELEAEPGPLDASTAKALVERAGS